MKYAVLGGEITTERAKPPASMRVLPAGRFRAADGSGRPVEVPGVWLLTADTGRRIIAGLAGKSADWIPVMTAWVEMKKLFFSALEKPMSISIIFCPLSPDSSASLVRAGKIIRGQDGRNKSSKARDSKCRLSANTRFPRAFQSLMQPRLRRWA